MARGNYWRMVEHFRQKLLPALILLQQHLSFIHSGIARDEPLIMRGCVNNRQDSYNMYYRYPLKVKLSYLTHRFSNCTL